MAVLPSIALVGAMTTVPSFPVWRPYEDSYIVGFEEGQTNYSDRYDTMQQNPERFGVEWDIDAYCEGYLDGKGDVDTQTELKHMGLI